MRFPLTEYGSDDFVTFGLQSSALDSNDQQSAELRLSWDLSNLEACIWPEFRELRREDELWRSTCLELFVGFPGTSAYLELNFSPSGSWNAYHFTNYRENMILSRDVEVTEIATRGKQVLTAVVQVSRQTTPARIGPAAVIETTAGELRYFAVEHGEKPDFHDATLHQRVDHL